MKQFNNDSKVYINDDSTKRQIWITTTGIKERFTFEHCYKALDVFYEHHHVYGGVAGVDGVVVVYEHLDKIIDLLLLKAQKQKKSLFRIIPPDVIDLHNCSKGMAYYYLAQQIYNLKNDNISYINVCQGRGNHSEDGICKLNAVLEDLKSDLDGRIELLDYHDNSGKYIDSRTKIKVLPYTFKLSAHTSLSSTAANSASSPPVVVSNQSSEFIFRLEEFPSLPSSNAPLPKTSNQLNAHSYLDNQGNPFVHREIDHTHPSFLDKSGNSLDITSEKSGQLKDSSKLRSTLNPNAKEFIPSTGSFPGVGEDAKTPKAFSKSNTVPSSIVTNSFFEKPKIDENLKDNESIINNTPKK